MDKRSKPFQVINREELIGAPFDLVRLPSAYLGDVTVEAQTEGNNNFRMWTFCKGLRGRDILVKSIDATVNRLKMQTYYPLSKLLSSQIAPTLVNVDILRANAAVIARLKPLEFASLSPTDQQALQKALQYNNAVDIHFATCEYVEYVHAFFGLNNVIRSNILCSLHNFAENVDNAFFMGDNMRYGNGATEFEPMGTLDITGHELGHGLVQTLSGLRYEGESGALNESFADIFGATFEFQCYEKVADLKGEADWTLGEDNQKKRPWLRNIKNPKAGQQPDKYGGEFWMDPTDLSRDYGGVHKNSGVSNGVFFRFATSIGDIKRALKIFIATLKLLKPNSKFADFARALRICAGDQGVGAHADASLAEAAL